MTDAEQMALINEMDEDDLRRTLIYVSGYSPKAFDKAVDHFARLGQPVNA